MLFSQNLLKSGWIVMNEEDARVIDSNRLAEERLATAAAQDVAAEKTRAYHPVSFDDESQSDAAGEDTVSRLFGEGTETDVPEQIQPELVESALAGNQAVQEAERQAEEILAQANARAEEILAQAAARAEADSRKAYDQAYEQGMQEGYQQGTRKALAEAEALKKEFEQKEMELNRQYEQQIEELEPYMIRELTGVYEHIFNVDLSQHRDLLQHMVANTLRNIAVSDNYLIHVSEQDYSFVTMQKARIMEEGCVGSAHMEIVEDRTLSRNECLIETADGIFDCSLAVQLEELKRKLQLLSYTGKKE